jgi:rsbT co-antagonist protein RsbR
LSQIKKVAQYIIDNKLDICNKITENVTDSLIREYTPSEKENHQELFGTLLDLMGRLMLDPDNDEILKEMVRWSKGIGQRDANQGLKITEALDLFPAMRAAFIENIGEIGLYQQISARDLILLNKEVNRILDISTNEVLKAYDFFRDRILKATQEEVGELSAPLVPVLDGVAVLPLIGAIDSYRAKFILNRVIPRASELRIKCLIIDFSGIQAIDTMVTDHIFKIHRILSLLGINAMLTGIRPSLAQTVVQIGIDFSSIQTFATVHKALEATKILK